MANQAPSSSTRQPANSSRGAKGRKLTCLCGQKHLFRQCYTINPNVRPNEWEIRKPIVTRINTKLHANAPLRKKILKLGYEYYSPPHHSQQSSSDTTKSSKVPCDQPIPNSVAPDGPEDGSATTVQPSQPDKPVKEEITFEKLPVEILVKILEQTYELSLDELPDSHPLITNEPPDITRTIRKPAAMTLLQNPKPPASMGVFGRLVFLWENPGQWGPFFQVMFASKRLYEIGKFIRYREVHLKSIPQYCYFQWDLPEMCNKLLHTQVLHELTKYIQLTVTLHHGPPAFINLANALKTLGNLRHLCITIKGDGDEKCKFLGDEEGIAGEEILDFFSLQVETLTLIWAYGGNKCYLDKPAKKNADKTYAPFLSHAEKYMQEIRSSWMSQVYNLSSWYRNADDNESSLRSKPKMSHDWTASKEGKEDSRNSEYCQWEMDRFDFTGKPSVCPSWNVWVNPRNHPDQMNETELKASRPVVEWRKGFDPY